MIRVFARMNGAGANTVGPDHFDVLSPDGRLSQYGGTCQAPGMGNQTATGRIVNEQNTGVNTIWALSHVQDLQGNTIDYQYDVEYSLLRDAGLHQTMPGQSTQPMSQSIRFQAADIPDHVRRVSKLSS